jgi:hypothetical protein
MANLMTMAQEVASIIRTVPAADRPFFDRAVAELAGIRRRGRKPGPKPKAETEKTVAVAKAAKKSKKKKAKANKPKPIDPTQGE